MFLTHSLIMLMKRVFSQSLSNVHEKNKFIKSLSTMFIYKKCSVRLSHAISMNKEGIASLSPTLIMKKKVLIHSFMTNSYAKNDSVNLPE